MADDYSEFKRVEEEPEKPKKSTADILRMLPRAMAQPFLDTAQGARHAFDKAVVGIGGLLPNPGNIPPPSITPKPDSFGGTVGSVGADVAMSAGPIGAANKAAGMLPRAMGKFAAVPADVAANAGYAAATAPEDREKAALYGGVGATGGRVLSATIGKMGRPTSTTPITQMMLDEGIELTPGQAGGWINRGLEGALYNTPFMPGVRRSVGTAQKAGQEQAEDFLTDAGRIAANPKAYGLTDAEAQRWIEGAENVNDVGKSTVPLQAIAALLHIKTGGATFAALAALYGTPTGRRLLLGQTSVQEALQQAPELAPQISQVMRAIATRDQSAPQE